MSAIYRIVLDIFCGDTSRAKSLVQLEQVIQLVCTVGYKGVRHKESDQF